MRHTLTIAGLVAALTGAGFAQEGGGEQIDPLKELQQALEKMRAAEELLAQSGRDEAARDQKQVEKLLEQNLDDAEMKQGGAAQKMLRAAEKAAVGVDLHIERVLGAIQFQQGQGGSGQMEMKQQPGGQRSEKDQGPQGLEKGQEPQGQEQPQDQTGGEPGQQARDMYDAKGRDGKPAGRDIDPNAWYDQMPAKLQEDALKERMETWPGRYEDLIREWQKTLAKLGSRRDR